MPGLLSSAGFGVRSESRAIASTTAPISTARPASCPPINRESSGTVAAASATRIVLWGFTGGSPSGPDVLGDGDGLELDGESEFVGFGDGAVLLGGGVGLEVRGRGGPVVGPEVGPALGVPVGVALALELDVDVALALLGFAPDVGRALVLVCVLAGTKCASRVAFFGIVLHAAFTIGPTGCTGPPASAANAWLTMAEETKAKPVRAPTTAGRTRRCAVTPDLTSCAPVTGCSGPP